MTSYHVHTRWSDGVATINEVVREAERIGLAEVGISDHFVIYPDGSPIEWSMDPDRVGEYVEAVLDATQTADGTSVRLGIEVDYLPETIERTIEALAPYPFDYIIGSVHYIDGFPIDGHRKYWDVLTEEQVNATWRAYYSRVQALAGTGLCDFVAHLDLPKKFGHAPSVDLGEDVRHTLDAISHADLAIEINTAGWSLPAHEAYPAPDILRSAHRRRIPILINSDAHTPRYLARDFERARALASEVGYRSVARYAGRRRSMHAI